MKKKHTVFNPNDIEFYVDENKKTVTCVLSKTSHSALQFIAESGIDVVLERRYSFERDHRFDRLRQSLKMPDRFVGVATCGADDTFDLETGKLIAYDRMRTKFDRAFEKRLQFFWNLILDSADKFQDYSNSYLNKVDINSERRQTIINQILEK